MKRNLLLTTFSLLLCTLGFSQNIHHVDYGNGLVIDSGQNYEMDINNDGVIDFSVNGWENELGFVPIFAVGCFASESYSNQTAWGSSVLQLFQEGDEIKIDALNMYDYLDEDRGSTFKPGEGTAEGWFNNTPNYIGFAVFHPEDFTVTNGWMKVKINTDTEQLIIMEYAYHDFGTLIGESSIVAGARGLVNVQNLDDVLSNVSISPNPVQDIFSVDFKYNGDENIFVTVLDNQGKEIIRRSGNGQSNLIFNASDWTNGIYFVNFNTGEGVHTERVFISH